MSLPITNKLLSLMKENNYSYADLEKLTSYSRSTLQRYFTGNTEKIPLDLIEEIAPVFGVTAAYLAGWEDSEPEPVPVKAHRIPVLGNVAAGIPIEMIEDIIDYEEIPANWGNKNDFFCLQIKGDSMTPKIDEGDVVVVRKQTDAETGDTVIFTVNGDMASCKRLRKTDSGLMFIPLNKDYDPMIYSWKEVEELPVRILGKVIELRAKF